MKQKKAQAQRFIIAQIVLLFLVLCGYGLFVNKQKNTASLKAEEFLSLIDAGQYNEAHDQWFSPEFEKSMTRRAFELNMQITHNAVGTKVDRVKTDTGFKFEPGLGKSVISINYSTNFQADNSAKEILVIEGSLSGNSWKINNYQIQSEKTVKY